VFLEKLVESLMLKRRQFSFHENFCKRPTQFHGKHTCSPNRNELNVESGLYTSNLLSQSNKMPPGARPSALIRCPICDIPLVNRLDYINHLRSIHPAYLTWGRKNAQAAFIVIVIVIGVIIIADFFFLSGKGLILFPEVGSFVAAVAIIIFYRLVKRRRFRHDWKSQHSEGTQYTQ